MRNADSGLWTRFDGIVREVSLWFERLGLVGLGAMAVTALVDVLGTKLFGLPLPGSTEITSVLQIAAIGAGLAYSQIDGRQIRVDIVTDFMPKRGKAVLDVFAAILGVLFFAVASWTLYEMGTNLASSGTRTLLLGIPLAPFAFWLCICCIPMCFAIFAELVNSIRGLAK